jgi:hypothetical protein
MLAGDAVVLTLLRALPPSAFAVTGAIVAAAAAVAVASRIELGASPHALQSGRMRVVCGCDALPARGDALRSGANA